jgi:ABC-2 type transport system ATP-binding protein
MYAVETRNLVRHFRAVKAVNGLNLQVPRGMVFGFLGPNGAGKTTTIHLLLGLLKPTAGKAQVLGFDVSTQSASIRSQAGVLFQHTGLYERLSVINNLKFYAKVWKIPQGLQESRIQDLLTQFGLWERRNHRTSRLSSGMKRKLAVARTLIHQPKLIILDEPTAGLDPLARARLQEKIIEICEKEEATIFITTHNLHEAEKICSRAAVIHEGKIIAQGDVDDLRKLTASFQIEVKGEHFDDRVLAALGALEGVSIDQVQETHLIIDARPGISSADINRTIINAGGSVEELKSTRANLEELFLSLVKDSDAD